MVNETAKRELMGEFPNEIIRASAGTGKTFALSNRYLKLLASGTECQTILATTFTKKGAGEILDRIINRLSDAALDDKAAEKLSSELNWQLTRDRAAKILHDLLKSLHRLEISTLDSFFNRVAKAFALELGLPPSWDIVDEQEINRMHDQAIEAVLRNDSVIHLLHMLSKGEATRRVASMVRDTVDQIYAIYRDSGDEPWDQLQQSGQFLNDQQLDETLAQIEAVEIKGKQLGKHWDEVKESARAGDWAGFAANKSFQRSLEGDYRFSRTKLPPEIVDIYKKMIPHCTAFIQNRLIQQNRSTRDLLRAFDEILEKRKNETGYLRFDDVTERLQEFVSMWDTDRFSFRLDHQIQHLLLDEFQDTSLAQWNVIRPFAKNVTEDDSLRSFFCVGDMKQAIFGWRGGVAEIFDLVGNELPNLEATGLSVSYRSSQPVIDLVNQVFSNVIQYASGDPSIDDAIHRWPEWFRKHETARSDLPGYVTIEMARECHTSQMYPIETKDRARNRNVMQRTIEKVCELVETIPDHHDIGVIVRTNDEVSELIFALQQAGIAASEEGGSSLTDSAAVEIILSAITLADHPGDSIARFHVSHSPLADGFGLEPETDNNQKENAAAVRVGAAQLRAQLVSQGYGPTVESLARKLIDKCTRRELLRIQQLVRIAFENPSVSDQWNLRPARFVQFVRQEVKVSDQSSARVRVMTIHKSKGLEFDVVVLPCKLRSQGFAGIAPNVVVGRDRPTDPIRIATRYVGEKLRKMLPEDFQEVFATDRQRNVQEAMCVMYVALTRGIHATHVILSHGAKHDHKSSSGVMLATVCPDAKREEGVLYAEGDPTWYQKTEKQVEEDRFDLSSFYLTANDPLTPAELAPHLRSRRGVFRSTPSQLVGGDEIRVRSVFESHDDHESKTRGKLLHGCFELVKWLDDSVPTKDQLDRHLRSIDPTQRDHDRVIAEFLEMLHNENIRKLLERSTYQETYLLNFEQTEGGTLTNRLVVQNERRFAVQAQSTMLEGQIDRLVLVYENGNIVAADVIDFKTESVEAPSLQSKIEYYRPQLQAYREAVSQFARIPIEKVAGRLVFVDSGQVVNLELIETAVEPVKPGNKNSPLKKGWHVDATAGSAVSKASVSNTGTANVSASKRPARANSSQKNPQPNPQPADPNQKRQQKLWD